MATRFSSNLEERIALLIESGQVANTEELVETAVRFYEQRHRQIEWLRNAIAESDAAIDRGECAEYSDELMDRLSREADEEFERGYQPSPDVRP